MSAKITSFQGMMSLDRQLVEKLQVYLAERETQAAKTILEVIHLPLGEGLLRPELAIPSEDIILSEAVEQFTKKVRRFSEGRHLPAHSKDWKLAASDISVALWKFAEVLEEGVTELFQQLGQIRFEKWDFELLHVVESIKDLLLHHLEETEWASERLEKQLWTYRWVLEEREGKRTFFTKKVLFWKRLIDKQLIVYLQNTQKLLKFKFKTFLANYQQHYQLNHKVNQSLHKFKNYPVFNSLDEVTRKIFIETYSLLKLWQINKKSDGLPQTDVIQAIRTSNSTQRIYEILSEYAKAIEEALFERSRNIKRNSPRAFLGEIGKSPVDAVINTYRAELHSLGAIVEKYRDFLLRTDPNPYVRGRWGFSEWIVGPEPHTAKQFLNLNYRMEEIGHLFEHLIKSVNGRAQDGFVDSFFGDEEIDRLLHEMGQPLTPKASMRSKAEHFVQKVYSLDELGTFNQEVVDYVGKTLARAMRIDWQYQVLFDIPLFARVYRIHEGIVGPIDDRVHLNRLNKFRSLIDQISNWVANSETQRHIHEIEMDMSDMKGYLQDFLAQVQRGNRQEENLFARELLEYRYLFGGFFHYLYQFEPEGKVVRKQFLFVDQYFESVENLMNKGTNV